MNCRRVPHPSQLPSIRLQVLRSFGAGVILATGFVHMFPDASAALGSACLGWPATFPWAAFIALMTSLAVLVSHSRWVLLKHRWLLEGSAMFDRSLLVYVLSSNYLADGLCERLTMPPLTQADLLVTDLSSALCFHCVGGWHPALLVPVVVVPAAAAAECHSQLFPCCSCSSALL